MRDAHGNCNSNADCHYTSQSYCYSNIYTDVYTYSNSHRYCYSNANRDADTETYTSSAASPDASTAPVVFINEKETHR